MQGDEQTSLKQLKDMAKEFTDERDWEQFHHPKDLAMGISMEAAELMEPFLWKRMEVEDIKTDRALMEKVEEELADVLILSMCMANTLGIDLSQAYGRKMSVNTDKYPADKVRGRADKYTQYR